jgi:hypothetical protein
MNTLNDYLAMPEEAVQEHIKMLTKLKNKSMETNTTNEQFDKVLFIKQYHETGKPSAKKIPCTVTGKMVTCFGQNLQAKIQKYGSVEALIEGFVSRGAKKA